MRSLPAVEARSELAGASAGAALLDFEAPYLEQKLLCQLLAATATEAARLFREIKRYLWLTELHPELDIPMYSVRVDEAWHQFILFTAEYAEFCQRGAGGYLHHAPRTAPEPVLALPRRTLSFAEFRAVYEAAFGDFAQEWFDELWLAPATRLAHLDDAEPLSVSVEAERALLRSASTPARVLCRVNLRARAALEFIAEHPSFLIRELPGLADSGERLELCRPLVKFQVLRLIP